MKIDLFLPPHLRGLKRGPAVILPKDAGYILAYTGWGKEDVVLECGAGSGFLTVQLARVCKKVIAVERRAEFCKIVKENLVKQNVGNVELVQEDLFSFKPPKGLDGAVLDLQQATEALAYLWPYVKDGGWLVGYLPNVEQAKAFCLKAKGLGSDELSMWEILARPYKVREQGVRPEHLALVHTAFLVFARKL